ncbi:MAG TPA: hypothetical protein VLT45_08425 [Kofleriaceae bacterium]|nr:hypothetical protein [Kofleriaceae bacterium]
MRGWLLLASVAACASPAPSSLRPGVYATDVGSYLNVQVGFADDPDIAVDVTFRGKTVRAEHAPQDYIANFDLVPALASDEVVTANIDGVALTLTAPTAFDALDVPLFVSRTQDTTISWSPASADRMQWSLRAANCVDSHGGDVPPNATSLTFTAADWMFKDQGIRTCTTQVQLTRARDTPIDPAFAGGGATFERDEVIEFASTP